MVFFLTRPARMIIRSRIIYNWNLIIYNLILKFVGFALAACAMPSRLTLGPRGSRYALAACATPSRLGLCPRSSGFALAACATPSQLGFALAGHATRSRLGLRRRRRWRRWQWKRRQRMLALAARATRLQARASPSRLGFSRFDLTA